MKQVSRVVVTKYFNSGSPAGKGQEEVGAGRWEEITVQPAGSVGRGHRKQLIVTMAGKKVSFRVSRELSHLVSFILQNVLYSGKYRQCMSHEHVMNNTPMII